MENDLKDQAPEKPKAPKAKKPEVSETEKTDEELLAEQVEHLKKVRVPGGSR